MERACAEFSLTDSLICWRGAAFDAKISRTAFVRCAGNLSRSPPFFARSVRAVFPPPPPLSSDLCSRSGHYWALSSRATCQFSATFPPQLTVSTKTGRIMPQLEIWCKLRVGQVSILKLLKMRVIFVAPSTNLESETKGAARRDTVVKRSPSSAFFVIRPIFLRNESPPPSISAVAAAAAAFAAHYFAMFASSNAKNVSSAKPKEGTERTPPPPPTHEPDVSIRSQLRPRSLTTSVWRRRPQWEIICWYYSVCGGWG